ncbi:MAG: hypothetical protein JWQ21_2406 [Herminiimonas sp.]|nr:hypothetical protein [Herminiimonas sp.]
MFASAMLFVRCDSSSCGGPLPACSAPSSALASARRFRAAWICVNISSGTGFSCRALSLCGMAADFEVMIGAVFLAITGFRICFRSGAAFPTGASSCGDGCGKDFSFCSGLAGTGIFDRLDDLLEGDAKETMIRSSLPDGSGFIANGERSIKSQIANPWINTESAAPTIIDVRRLDTLSRFDPRLLSRLAFHTFAIKARTNHEFSSRCNKVLI